jgi:hypothetical protein
MADQRVDIKVRIPLELDTGGVDQTVAKIPKQVREAAERATQSPAGKIGWNQPPLGRQDVDLQTRVYEKLRETIGPQISFIKNKKEINALYKEELMHVRTMEEELSRLKRTEHGLTNEQLRRRERDAQEARHFVNRLRDTIAVETARENLMGGADRGGGLLDMSAQQAMNGGLIGAGMNMVGRFVMAHPVLAGTALTIGAANWLLNKTDEWARYSEDLDIAFTNTGRRTGMGRNLRGLFQARLGATDRDFAGMGYSGEDLAKLADAYGMPAEASAFRSALRSQGAFARAFGFGEHADMISGIGRRATQLGMAEAGQQTGFWQSMAAAVERGMRVGVDASETMRSIMALSEQAAGHLGVISADYRTGLAGMQAALSSGDSRFFKGERGAQQVATVLDAFQHPKTIGQERLMMNALMAQFGGRVPTADAIGLTGARAAAFGQMTEIQQMQAIMQLLPELMANGKGTGLLSGLARQAALGAGPAGEQLLFQAMTGMDAGGVLNAVDAMSSSISKRFGAARADELAGRPLSMLADLSGEGGAPTDIAAIMRGKPIDGTSTPIEDLRQRQREVHELFSKTVSDSTIEVRRLGEAAKLAADNLLNYLTTTPVEQQIKDIPSGILGLLKDYGYARSGLHENGRPGLVAPGATP